MVRTIVFFLLILMACPVYAEQKFADIKVYTPQDIIYQWTIQQVDHVQHQLYYTGSATISIPIKTSLEYKVVENIVDIYTKARWDVEKKITTNKGGLPTISLTISKLEK